MNVEDTITEGLPTVTADYAEAERGECSFTGEGNSPEGSIESREA